MSEKTYLQAKVDAGGLVCHSPAPLSFTDLNDFAPSPETIFSHGVVTSTLQACKKAGRPPPAGVHAQNTGVLVNLIWQGVYFPFGQLCSTQHQHPMH